MIIKNNKQTMMIADNSPKALKIIDGYDYTINDKGDLMIGGLGTVAKNKWQLKKKLEKVNDIDDIKILLKELVDAIIE